METAIIGNTKEFDRLPYWIKLMGLISIGGITIFSFRTVYEHTFLAWEVGAYIKDTSQYTWYIESSLPFMTFILFLQAFFGWCIYTVGRSIWFRLKGVKVSIFRWGIVLLAIAILMIQYFPPSKYQEIFIDRFVNNPHSTEFLFMAVSNGDLSLAQLYIDHNVDVNSRGLEGATPIFWAINKENLKLVQFLLDKGAEINVQDDKGRTPLSVAKEKRFGSAIKLLEERGAQ